MYKNNRRFRPRFNNRGRGRAQGSFRIKSFDPSQIVNQSIGLKEEKAYLPEHAFGDFAVSESLKSRILKRGFVTPTPIQDRAIPEILNGRDVVGIANTGTGKTAAFLIPLINKALLNRKSKSLIIAPTRELAAQIDTELQVFSHGLGIYSATCIGGLSIRGQIRLLQRQPGFVIGTPGRLLDLESQRKINFAQFDSIVMDEVDRMLDMGFIHDVNKIVSKLPSKRQSLFFAATIDEKVKDVMSKFTHNPVTISVKTTDASVNVRQDIVAVKGRNKAEVLQELLDTKEVSKTLIFTRTKRGADTLHRSLSKIKFHAVVLHGNKSQGQRQRSLEQFRRGQVNILIATDVASRGIDVNDISHVINYDLPESRNAYIHRIGRTGRANKKGTAITFVG